MSNFSKSKSERIRLSEEKEQLIIETCQFIDEYYLDELSQWEMNFFADFPTNLLKYHNITEAQFEVLRKTYKKYEKKELPYDFESLKPQPNSKTKKDIEF